MAPGDPSRPASNPLNVSLAGIALRNPIVLAAGTCGVMDEMKDVLDLAKVGAVTTKSITLAPREGNDTWRILDAGAAGMLNAIGLANPGLDAFLSHYGPKALGMPCPVFASVAGFSIDEYVRVAANIDDFAAEGKDRNGFPTFAAIELNVSCPNVKTGTEFGGSAAVLAELMAAVRPVVKATKLFVKLGPMTPEIVNVARAAVSGGADALVVANTIPAMAIDVETRKPRLANVTGGLSGAGVHPVTLRLVHEVHRKLAKERGTPIIGLGGVMRWEDAAEFVLAGATAVGIGTGLFADPRLPIKIARGLEKWCGRQGRGIEQLRGALEA